MKKLLMALAILSIGVASCYAQTKAELNAAKTKAKAEAKVLKKQGFSVLGTRSLQEALEKHMLDRTSPEAVEIVGRSEGAKSIVSGKEIARQNALHGMLERGIISEFTIWRKSKEKGKTFDVRTYFLVDKSFVRAADTL